MMNTKIYIDYDNTNLKKISDDLYNIFKSNNYNVTLLNEDIPINEKINIIKNTENAFVISNKLNNNNYIEIVYPLKDNNLLAKELFDTLSSNYNVNKYYQLRSPNNTSLDYYEILRDINGKGILIKYNSNILNDNNISKILYQVIIKYLNNSNVYIVKSGDSLYSIAKKFNTTVDELKKVNNLTNNILSINQKLIIPSSNINSNSNDFYIVKSGDSLYSIAKKYNTTVDELKKVNNLTNNLLSINQKLIIPSNNYITYVVNKGDSLYSIAKKFNTTVNKIKKDNNLTSNLLSINQKLIIK